MTRIQTNSSNAIQSTSVSSGEKKSIRWGKWEVAIFSAGTGFAFGISGAALGTLIAPGLGTLIGFIVGVAVGILFGVITTTRHNDSEWNKT